MENWFRHIINNNSLGESVQNFPLSMKVVKKFKTFRDLVLRKTSKYDPTLRARLTFDNNYGVSMIRDNLLKNQYEIAVLHNNELCYNTSITSDTVKGLTGREVTKLMEKIQKL